MGWERVEGAGGVEEGEKMGRWSKGWCEGVIKRDGELWCEWWCEGWCERSRMSGLASQGGVERLVVPVVDDADRRKGRCF